MSCCHGSSRSSVYARKRGFDMPFCANDGVAVRLASGDIALSPRVLGRGEAPGQEALADLASQPQAQETGRPAEGVEQFLVDLFQFWQGQRLHQLFESESGRADRFEHVA